MQEESNMINHARNRLHALIVTGYPIAIGGQDFRAIGVLAVLLGVMFCLTAGCRNHAQGTSPTPVASSAEVKDMSNKVKDLEVRLQCLITPETYQYSSAGKADLFQPFWAAIATPSSPSRAGGEKRVDVPPENCATALECIDVGQLTLVAVVVQQQGSSVAMAQDAAGVGYLLKQGVRVGYRNGRVTEILSDRVIVTEEIEDINGKIVAQDRALLLHPEGK